jgi:hypothetical protein
MIQSMAWMLLSDELLINPYIPTCPECKSVHNLPLQFFVILYMDFTEETSVFSTLITKN